MGSESGAASVVTELEATANPERAAESERYFKTGPGEYGEGDRFLGLTMSQVSQTAREHLGLSVADLETLLDSDWHEVRTTALAIMNAEARKKRTTDERRRELFELYLRKHDRINNWDLVDLGCHAVVGGYLIDKPRDILYELARSPVLWERRTAMVSCGYLIKQGQTDDALAIAELLLGDREDLIHKATGWMLRTVGDVDRAALTGFLDQHAATMPRTALRYAIEKFDPVDRAHYLGMKTAR
ncbi:MAG TPA: DNA alkylation repair protein [Rhodoglobus sp.]|jgi:3-methyladenine DNA glycosylase AlkD|nr:DNA alkylation repair protein [Rhodoglobus sp.]HPM51571.1 DNA alkylation repair protein [Rhodoglobus sp.]